ncbi:MAG: hypothetical protein HOY79_40750 [Streptomyces sp.]|nr:hypothetical protein [Streptomyces sp.]
MADTAKSSTISRVTEEGYISSYGTLLYLTASMGPEPRHLEPDTPMELAVWHGHFQGLRAALLCLAMHERQLAPKAAAQWSRRLALESGAVTRNATRNATLEDEP